MSLPSLSIRLQPLPCTVGDISGNEQLINSAITQAQQDQVQLLILPELAICGYPPEDLLLRDDFLTSCNKALHHLAESVSTLQVLVGAPRDQDGLLYNSIALLHDGKLSYLYNKQLLPNYGVFDEKRYFTAGEQSAVLQIEGVSIGLSVCEDIWGEDVNKLVTTDIDLLVNLSASPYHRNKGQQRQQLLIKRSKQLNAPILYCNLIGGQDELVFDGHCLAVDESGVIAETQLFSQTHLDINEQGGHKAQPLNELEEIYQALVLSTRDYAHKSGFQQAVLGLSGGIDSALVALVACDALGADNVNAVIMPSEYSSADTQNDADALAADLAMPRQTLPIHTIIDAYHQTLAPSFVGKEADVTEENLQARTRGALLMALSNKFGWLLLSTGNKSEMAVGYCTLYGDMCGGFSVLKDAPKTLVFALTEWRAKALKSPALQRIIERPPSAELALDQKDSDSLPPYHILDPILTAYVEELQSEQQIVANGYPQQTVSQIIHLVNRAEYKRRQAAPGPKLTARAFGRERRMPIVNRYKGGS